MIRRMDPTRAADRIVLIALGGTISMGGVRKGIERRLPGSELAGAAGVDSVDLDIRDPRSVPGGSLTFADLIAATREASEAVRAGARGVVVTQGTDTMEETAFLVDCLWDHDAPFVFTGAMRNPTLPGPDGPANLAAAIRTAAADDARGRGVLVVFNDEIHAARFVRKTHSTSPAAFRSPDAGPIGHIVEGVARFVSELHRRPPVVHDCDPARIAATRVALYTATFDDDGALLEHVAQTHHGLVVAGFGVGHVPAALAPVFGALAQAMPVVLTSRTGAGSVLSATYPSVGSERDLLERGLINGGFVHPYQARVLLRLLLAAGSPRDAIAETFAALG
jgi:L-asparaginase